MKKILLTFIFSCFSMFSVLEAKDSEIKLLDKTEQSIIEISTLTTLGDTQRLVKALNTALDNGMTINEVNEVLVQIYAYAGFPRSLGGIFTFMKVVDDRKAKGIEDERGREATPISDDLNRDKYGAEIRAMLAGQENIPKPSGYQLFSPTIDKFLKEHLFADIFARDLLNHKQRELSTISVLAALGNVTGPLKFHLNASKNVGWNKQELEEFVLVLKRTLDKKKVEDVKSVLENL